MVVDLRIRKLARLVVNYSLNVKPNENVMISGGEESIPFMVELYKEVIFKGANPVTRFALPGVSDFFYKYANQAQLEHFPDYFFESIKKMDKYVGIHSEKNTRELTNVDSKKISERKKVTSKISNYIVNEKDKIRRCTVGFPCEALAQEAEMSLNEYENFFYGACLQNWEKLGVQLDKICDTFSKGNFVELKGEGIDLSFSIKDKNCVSDKGEENMPGGEVFMAPVRDSLSGWVQFDFPAINNGKEVTDIFLKFENGKVIESRASKNESFLNEMLNTDKNSRYVGEFGIGCNPKINRFTKDLLFDEKIGGTIHLALGMAYKENGGGNDSAIHWDIVKDMKKGKIILDGIVVQDKGIWRI